MIAALTAAIRRVEGYPSAAPDERPNATTRRVAKLAYPCARSMWQNAESFQEARQNRHDHHRPRRDQPPRDAR